MSGIWSVKEFLDRGGQAQANVCGLLGNKPLNQPPIEGRNSELFLDAPGEQYTVAGPASQLAQNLQSAHCGHGIVNHAYLGEGKAPSLIVAPILQDLRDQRDAALPAVDDFLLTPAVGFPAGGLLHQLGDAINRAHEQPHMPVWGHDLGQHFQIVRVVVKKHNAAWPPIKCEGHVGIRG